MTELINPFDELFEPLRAWLRTMPLWLAAVVFAGYIAALFVVQWIVFRGLHRLTGRSGRSWLNVVVRAFQSTIVIFLLSATVGLLPSIFKIPREYRGYFASAAECLVFLALAVLAQKILMAAYQRMLNRDPSMRTYSGIARILIIAIVYSTFLLIFLEMAGISITPLIASLGVGSLAVGLALQDTLANFFAGINVVTNKPIRVGDYVRLESGDEGMVESIGWRNVRIRTLMNNVVVAANSKVANSQLTNYSQPERGVTFLVPVSVDYASKLDFVEKVTLELASDVQKTVDGADKEFAPLVRFSALGDSGVNFNVILRACEFSDIGLMRHEFLKKIHARYEQEGIGIPYPTRRVFQQALD